MTKKEYNGWTNYETWAVNLWIGNDEASSRYWQDDRARAAWNSKNRNPAVFSKAENAAIVLADWRAHV